MSGEDLTALIGSRICHDLVSPLGAIGNGVELLTMSGTTAGPELALITESIENANARIRFFRVAFGAASVAARMGRGDIAAILDGIYRTGRLSVTWAASGDHLRREVKLAFLAIQCLESSLPWGGEVTVGVSDRAWTLVGSGERIKHDAALWERAAGGGGPEDLSASDVHFALLPLAAEAAGREVKVEANPVRIRVTF